MSNLLTPENQKIANNWKDFANSFSNEPFPKKIDWADLQLVDKNIYLFRALLDKNELLIRESIEQGARLPFANVFNRCSPEIFDFIVDEWSGDEMDQNLNLEEFWKEVLERYKENNLGQYGVSNLKRYSSKFLCPDSFIERIWNMEPYILIEWIEAELPFFPQKWNATFQYFFNQQVKDCFQRKSHFLEKLMIHVKEKMPDEIDFLENFAVTETTTEMFFRTIYDNEIDVLSVIQTALRHGIYPTEQYRDNYGDAPMRSWPTLAVQKENKDLFNYFMKNERQKELFSEDIQNHSDHLLFSENSSILLAFDGLIEIDFDFNKTDNLQNTVFHTLFLALEGYEQNEPLSSQTMNCLFEHAGMILTQVNESGHTAIQCLGNETIIETASGLLLGSELVAQLEARHFQHSLPALEGINTPKIRI